MSGSTGAAASGGESEKSPERDEAPVSLAGLDPAAAAAAMDVAQRDPVLAAKAGVYFDKLAQLLDRQSRLAELQAEHKSEQRKTMLSNLRLKKYSDLLRVGVQFFFALVFTGIGIGLITVMRDAATSHAIVVEPFDTPAALAARGTTGKALASDILDALRTMQAATRTDDKGLATTSAWASDIKIEVPQTGVSVGEILRLLRERLGHDLHISGGLEQTENGGLVLTVRSDDVSSATFEGSAGDIRKLTGQAAEYLYGHSQPVRYAAYLSDQDRNDEAMAFIPLALARASDGQERAKLVNMWGYVHDRLNQPAAAIEKYRIAMTLAGSNWISWHHIVYDKLFADGEEAAWQEGKAYLDAADKTPPQDKPAFRHVANPAQVTWDFALMLASNLDETKLNNGSGASAFEIGVYLADSYALTHDPASAARVLALSDQRATSTKDEAFLLQAFDALDRGTPEAAIAPMEAYWAAWQKDPAQQYSYPDYPCYLGLAYGMAGRIADADALFKRLGSWSRCFAFHGDVLAHAGDPGGAEQVWAEGLKAAPDLPIIYLHRGMVKMARGEMEGAQSDFAVANGKAPHWADALKAWGDLLARQGKWKEALAKYGEGLNYAPNWQGLRDARDAAVVKK